MNMITKSSLVYSVTYEYDDLIFIYMCLAVKWLGLNSGLLRASGLLTLALLPNVRNISVVGIYCATSNFCCVASCIQRQTMLNKTPLVCASHGPSARSTNRQLVFETLLRFAARSRYKRLNQIIYSVTYEYDDLKSSLVYSVTYEYDDLKSSLVYSVTYEYDDLKSSLVYSVTYEYDDLKSSLIYFVTYEYDDLKSSLVYSVTYEYDDLKSSLVYSVTYEYDDIKSTLVYSVTYEYDDLKSSLVYSVTYEYDDLKSSLVYSVTYEYDHQVISGLFCYI